MISKEELNLSKLSYSDKDFASIYLDELDLARQLTNKWDPSLSNESDPGVVLLKESAFIADHLNYNADKNILEAFLPSATQESSVRNILEVNGYEPGYYTSAAGNLSFSYISQEGDPSIGQGEESQFRPFTIPPFTITVTNKNSDITYTQIESISINKPRVSATAKFLEGTLLKLTVSGSDVILLENLDDNNRLYFPTAYIAKNGVYVNNVGEADYWENTNYLYTLPNNSKAYKFGYSSAKNLPYIEFPSDIANIIGDGLNINYIVTSGLQGNVSANTLTQLVSPTQFKPSDYSGQGSYNLAQGLSISNQYSILNGKDPETLNEMYSSFKKIVGTFETLVTCNDYSNAARVQTDQYDQLLLSNAFVSDRTNDFNKSLKIITYDQYGEYVESAVQKTEKIRLISNPDALGYIPKIGDITFDGTAFRICVSPEVEPENWPIATEISFDDFVNICQPMTADDLLLYALNSYVASVYNDGITSQEAVASEKEKQYYMQARAAVAMNMAYMPVTKSINQRLYQTVLSKLSENKCISHNFIDQKDGDVFMYINDVPLSVTITPYFKVSELEKNEIINNVLKALLDNFNPTKLEFGEEFNQDEIIQIIEDSDDRIRSIRLQDLEYYPAAVIMKDNGQSVTDPRYLISKEAGQVTVDQELMADILAKNVLAGRMCLFEFDETYQEQYGMYTSDEAQASQEGEYRHLYTDIGVLSTEARIPLSESGTIVESGNVTNFTPDISDFDKVRVDSGSWVIPSGTTDQPGLLQIPDGVKVTFYSTTTGEEVNYISQGSLSSSEYSVYLLLNPTNSAVTVTTSGVNIGSLYIKLQQKSLEVHSYDSTSLMNYQINPNEFIQVSFPSYVTDITYPQWCYYRFENSDTEDPTHLIYADEDYTLLAGESLTFIYTEDDRQKVDKYQPGDVVRSTFDIRYTDQESATKQKKTYVDPITSANLVDRGFLGLTAGQSIDHRVLQKTVLSNNHCPCYWFVNNSTNTLFKNGAGRTNQRILNQGEYFIYSDANLSNMTICGAGTMLTRGDDDNQNWSYAQTTTNIELIQKNGLSSNINWQYMEFSNSNQFIITEMNMLTLAEGDKISIYDWSPAGMPDNLNNSWVNCDGAINYSSNGTSTTLHPQPSGYWLRSRLDVIADTDSPQLLYSGQHVLLKSDESHEAEVELVGSSITPVYLQSSIKLDLFGEDNINIQQYSDSNISFMIYNLKKPVFTTTKFTVDSLSDTRTIDFSDISSENAADVYFSDQTEDGDVSEKSCYYKSPNSVGYTKLADMESSEQWVKDLFDDIDGDVTSTANTFSLNDYSQLITQTLYNKDYQTTELDLAESYPINIQGTFDLSLPFLYENKINTLQSFGSEKTYLIPIYITGSEESNCDINVMVSCSKQVRVPEFIEDDYFTQPVDDGDIEIGYGSEDYINLEQFDSDTNITIREYNSGNNFAGHITIKSPGVHLLEINLNLPENSDDTETTLEFELDLNLILSNYTGRMDESDEIIPSQPQSVTIMPIKTVTGGNNVFTQYVTLSQVLDRISDLVKNSDHPDTIPYYLHIPDNSTAIQDYDSITDPDFMWDKNNIVNRIIIPRINFSASSIDIVKSMRDYR